MNIYCFLLLIKKSYTICNMDLPNSQTNASCGDNMIHLDFIAPQYHKYITNYMQGNAKTIEGQLFVKNNGNDSVSRFYALKTTISNKSDKYLWKDDDSLVLAKYLQLFNPHLQITSIKKNIYIKHQEVHSLLNEAFDYLFENFKDIGEAYFESIQSRHAASVKEQISSNCNIVEIRKHGLNDTERLINGFNELAAIDLFKELNPENNEKLIIINGFIFTKQDDKFVLFDFKESSIKALNLNCEVDSVRVQKYKFWAMITMLHNSFVHRSDVYKSIFQSLSDSDKHCTNYINEENKIKEQRLLLYVEKVICLFTENENKHRIFVNDIGDQFNEQFDLLCKKFNHELLLAFIYETEETITAITSYKTQNIEENQTCNDVFNELKEELCAHEFMKIIQKIKLIYKNHLSEILSSFSTEATVESLIKEGYSLIHIHRLFRTHINDKSYNSAYFALTKIGIKSSKIQESEFKKFCTSINREKFNEKMNNLSFNENMFILDKAQEKLAFHKAHYKASNTIDK